MSQKPDIGQDASAERRGALIFVQCSKIELVFMKCQMDTEERTHIFFKYRNVLKKNGQIYAACSLQRIFMECGSGQPLLRGRNTQKSYLPCVTFA